MMTLHIAQERQNSWILLDKDRDDAKFIEPNLRGIHKMAFSEQFYFVAAALTYGSLLAVYGGQACIYNAYQLYRDLLFPFLCIIMLVICWSRNRVSSFSRD